MYFVSKLAFVAAMAASVIQAAVIPPPSGGDPHTQLPALVRAENNNGFGSIDPDGIYRSYHVNGTVVDAARLTRAQIDTYLAAVEDFAGAERAGAERVHFDAVLAAAAVPEEQLLHPPPEVVPTDELAAKLEQVEKAAKGDGGAEKGELGACEVRLYCWSKQSKCTPHKCWCNGSICVGDDGS
ncbi:hypothetical protein PG996_012499 [Apiospora saccharicola]|uniref:Uncharacterized protein n=1 Tax=Apiospora saccharicola TaxID=335842 RepID=A0ABR1U2Z4_9PEZI